MKSEPPAWWELTLIGGQTLEVWADMYGESEDCYEFQSLVDADESEQRKLEIAARTPSNPQRVIVTVARVPREIVATIRGGGGGKSDWMANREAS